MSSRKTSEKVLKRRDRVFDLVMVDGYDDAAAIADVLLGDGSMASRSRESAIRLVQSDVALLRDVTEAHRYVERRLFAMRRFRSIAIDDSEIEFEVITPKGDTVTVRKPRWPAGVRTRALKSFSDEAEALARIAGVDVTGKRKAPQGRKDDARFKGFVQLDLTGLGEEDRKAISDAMKQFPGAGEGDDGKGGNSAPN